MHARPRTCDPWTCAQAKQKYSNYVPASQYRLKAWITNHPNLQKVIYIIDSFGKFDYGPAARTL